MTGPLGEVDLPAPSGDRWFEDYVARSVDKFRHASLSETEIVAYARHYDRSRSTPTRLGRRRGCTTDASPSVS